MRRTWTKVAFVCLAACAGGPRWSDRATAAPAADAVAAAFCPAAYEGEMFTDYVALRDVGLLDRLERMAPFGDWLQANAAALGCELDDLLRVRTAIVFGQRRDHREVSIAEVVPGRARPPRGGRWAPDRLGPHDAWRLDHGRPSDAVMLFPGPGCVVGGERDLLERVVTGAEAAGGPHGDLAPLLAGERLLFQYAFGRFGRRLDELTGTFGFYWFDERDPVDFVRVRLTATPAGEVVLSILFRFAHGTTGLQAVADDVRGHFEQILAERQLVAFHDLVRDVVLERTGRDLEATLVLGVPMAAIRRVERLVVAVVRVAEAREDQRRR